MRQMFRATSRLGLLVGAVALASGCGDPKCMTVKGMDALITQAALLRVDVYAQGSASCDGPTLQAGAGAAQMSRTFKPGEALRLDIAPGPHVVVLTTYSDADGHLPTGSGCTAASFAAGAGVCLPITLALVSDAGDNGDGPSSPDDASQTDGSLGSDGSTDLSGACMECPTPVCCNGACEVKHANGIGQNYYDCAPLGTPGGSGYTQQMAMEAADAWGMTGTMGTMSCQGMASCISVQTASQCSVWCYTKGVSGRVDHQNSVNTCTCPTVNSQSWN
jgi:hypothetical protein